MFQWPDDGFHGRSDLPPLAAPSSSARPRRALALMLLLFTAWAAAFIQRSAVTGPDGRTCYCLFDDAMISMRYAWNCAHGLGLVWNAGERVEGVTNFLLTVLMIPFTAVLSKSLAVLAVQCCGVGVTIGVALLTRRLAGFFVPGGGDNNEHSGLRDLREVFLLLCAAGALAWYPLAFCALMGLESGLLALLLLGALVLAFRGEPKAAFSPGMAVLLGLAFMTRPDAALAIVAIMGYRALTLLGDGRRARAVWIWLTECAIIAFFIGALTLFRWGYYGSPVPNTYRLKLGGFPLAFRLPQGVGYVARFLPLVAPLLVLAVSGVVRRFSARRALLLALALLFIAYPAWIGGDALPHWRLLVPAFPLLLILALEEACDWAARFAKRLDGRSRNEAGNARRMAIVAFGAMLMVADLPYLRHLTLIESPGAVTVAERNVTLALALDQLTGPDATLAVSWAGIIPYYTGRRAIDLLGKSDPAIAALAPDLSGAASFQCLGSVRLKSVPGHNKYDLVRSIVERRPTYVELFTWGRQDVRDFARANYVQLGLPVAGKVERIALLRGSPDVHWEKLPKPQP